MKQALSIFFAALIHAWLGQGQAPSAPVHVAQVVEQKVASTVELVGTVLPRRRSIVASGADGLVVALSEGGDVPDIQEGDAVTEGQVLALLRTRTLRIQEEAAKAVLEESQQQLQELQARLRSDDPERAAEIERARGALAAGEAKKKMAETKHQRLERLSARNAASGEDVSEALGLLVMAQEDVAKLKADSTLAKLGPRAEKIKQAEARVEAAEAELRRIQDEIEKRTVRAPFDGYVIAKLTEKGQWLSTSSPVFEIVDLEEVDVQVMLPERNITQIRQKMEVSIRIQSLGDLLITGKEPPYVSKIIRQADTKSRLFPVMIRLKNPIDADQRPLVQAGMFAVAQLPLGAKHIARLVPKDSLVLQAGKSFVFVVEGNGNGHKVTSVAVKPGSAHEGLIEVEGNLKPGQLVVVRGNERLADGQTVQIEGRIDNNGDQSTR